MLPAQNPSFVTIGCQKTVLLRNTQYYCSNVQPRAELTSALKGTVSRNAETVDAVARVSDLFHKIAGDGKGKRKMESTPYSPKRPPSGATSKGGQQANRSTNRTPSKGAGRSRSG